MKKILSFLAAGAIALAASAQETITPEVLATLKQGYKGDAADRVGDFPVFQAERDVINPQRQQWVIEQNAKTGRYKIFNKQDGRYINETGAFWFNKDRNPFDAAWHTYLLVKQEGKWSIQNAGSGGKGYWHRDGNRIKADGSGQFIFEIEKVK